MDGQGNEHSDSDSGESWTLLDNQPSYGEEPPVFAENFDSHVREPLESTEKDEDTDGISIITDSEPESSVPEQIIFEEQCEYGEIPPVDRPAERSYHQEILAPLPENIHEETEESTRCEDCFLGDTTGKMKTYVHRRNKKLSTVLNIILLGSVITAAGVALGHMWGAKEECPVQSTPSVNKILSNLYKLQEENEYLRNKVRELTIANSIQLHQRKSDVQKLSIAKQKCKKVFEEPLQNKNVARATKCVDGDHGSFVNSLSDDLSDEFLSDINKLKNIYKQNQSWLDNEIATRLKEEEVPSKRLKTPHKNVKTLKDKENTRVDSNLTKEQLQALKDFNDNTIDFVVSNPSKGPVTVKPYSDKTISSYADKVKSAELRACQLEKLKTKSSVTSCVQQLDKKTKRGIANVDLKVISEDDEDEIMKDNRYVGNKRRIEPKKYDRQKGEKRNKRDNKYEQWLIKGGYLKDYDSVSIMSNQETDDFKDYEKKHFSKEFERQNHINEYTDVDETPKSVTVEVAKALENQPKETKLPKHKHTQTKGEKFNEPSWYEKRATLRKQARQKQEDISENSKNTARWYFRRMNKREQSRSKSENDTQRKINKKNFNYKAKR